MNICRAGLLISLVAGVLVGVATGRLAQLRTGEVALSSWSEGGTADLQSRTAGATDQDSLSEDGSGMSGGVDSGELAGVAPLGLYLVAYIPGPRQQRLHAALSSRGANVVSYIPDQTWVVAMSRQAAEDVAQDTGAEMAPLGPQHRVAPEWGPLLAELRGAAAATGQAELQGAARRQRRRMQQSEGQGRQAEAVVEGAASEPWPSAGDAAAAAAAAERAARAVDQLQTYTGPVPAGQEGQARRRAAAGVSAGGIGAEPPPPQRYGLLAELLPVGLTAAALVAAEVEWPAALAAALDLDTGAEGPGGPCWPLVQAPRGVLGAGRLVASASGGPALLTVYLCAQHLTRGVSWLSRQWAVQWVEPQLAVQLSNAVADVIGQRGGVTPEQYRDPLTVSKPYWQAGLDGSGEIVGVSDTGLDLSSCYFYDPRYAAAIADLRAKGVNSSTVVKMANHRKVVLYSLVEGADFAAPTSGHGTHTAGIVAGALAASGEDPVAPYRQDAATGAAPGARLSVVDISSRNGTVKPPQPVEDLLLPIHASAGVCVTSDSWGALTAAYTAMAGGYDRYLWNFADGVALISAGNYGATPGLSTGSLMSPAFAKNVIAVGASLKAPPQTLIYATYTVRGTRQGQPWRMVVWPVECRDKGTQPWLNALGTNATLDLVAAEWELDAVVAQLNSDGDGGIDGGGGGGSGTIPTGGGGDVTCRLSAATAAAARGAVVLLPALLNCSLVAQALAVQRAGGVAALFGAAFNPLPSAPVLVRNSSADISSTGVTILVAYVSKALEGWVRGNATASSRVTFSTGLSSAVGINSLPSFSSYGPTPDGRIKPDIVAPGFELMSAWTNDKVVDGCGSLTITRSGTSMAAPTAAGHTAIMRQYLRTGFYPTGASTDRVAAPFTPSGMLLKALIIVGATSLEGGEAMATGARMGPPPDGFQGWGRLSLSGSLPLRGHTDGLLALQVADRGQFTATGQELEIGGLKATGTGPITVALTWYDYPSDRNAPLALVNDLDLAVEVTGGGAGMVTLLGNNPQGAASPSPDRVNTVERVFMSAPPPGASITLRVRAYNLPSAFLGGPNYTGARLPQRFAVAVVGHFTGTLETPLNPAYLKLQALGLTKPPPNLLQPPFPKPSPAPTTSSPSPKARKTPRSPPPVRAATSPSPAPSPSPSALRPPPPTKGRKKLPPPPAVSSPPRPPKKRGS